MRFDKYQGLGNDFVIVDAQAEQISDFARAARAVCDRRFGIGADGLVLLWKQPNGVKMRIFIQRSRNVRQRFALCAAFCARTGLV